MKAIDAKHHDQHGKTLADAMLWYEVQADKADEFFDAKSDKWAESEAGQNYAEWKEGLRNIHEAIRDAVDLIESLSVAPERPD